MHILSKHSTETNNETKLKVWDVAVPLPKMDWEWCYSTKLDKRIYEVKTGEYFKRLDGLIVFIDYVSVSSLVLAVNARSGCVYRAYATEFSTWQTKWDKGTFQCHKLLWTRLSKEDAKKELRLTFKQTVEKIWSRSISYLIHLLNIDRL